MAEGQVQQLCKMINDPQSIDPQKIEDIVQELCDRREVLNIRYDGDNFCLLSGEILKDQETMELSTDLGIKVVLKSKLQELIEKHCFWDGVFEWSFAKIHNVKFIGDPSQTYIQVDERILNQVYGDTKYAELIKNVENFYLESERQCEQYRSSITFKCPKLGKVFYSLSDGINIQSITYSLDGALQLLEEQREVLFQHQIDFLEAYKRQKEAR